MTATHPSQRPDPTRSGAVWVTGLGAFLLLAAAAVFTAVSWDRIPDAAKLAALVGATGSCLLAGRSLRPTLPATAGALTHLGAFLVPVDVAALGVRAQLDWSSMLLVQGAVATVTFAWAARAERSVVLRWATAGALVVLAGGIGATTPIPAPLALAAIAVVALAAREDSPAIALATAAGMAPLLAYLDVEITRGAGVAERLGLTGDGPRGLAILTGVSCAGVLATIGRRREDVGLALIGVGVGALGIAATFSSFEPSQGASFVAAATAFLTIELVAHATRRDPFWARATGPVARLSEVAAGAGTLVGAGAGLLALTWEGSGAAGALSLSVLGVGWMVTDLRASTRVSRRVALLGAALAGTSAVAVGTESPELTALACIAVAAAALFTPDPRRAEVAFEVRPGAHGLVAIFATAAPLVAILAGAWDVVVAGLAGALLLTEAAVARSVLADPARPAEASRHESWAWSLALLAAAPAFVGAAGLAEATHSPVIALIAGTVLAGGLVLQADRGRAGAAAAPLGTPARLHPLFLLAAGASLPPVELGSVALVVAVISAADAIRIRRPEAALSASVALPVAIGTLVHATGLTMPSTGVALTVAAGVLAGLGWHLGARWSVPVVASVGLCLGAGMVLAAGDPSAFADAVMVSGGLGLAASIAVGRLDGVFVSGAVVTAGVWLRLADGGVGASEPYLAPVCVLLLMAGLRARSIGTSSWIAYGPVVGVLGGSALLERISGGPAWHAIIAGAVGIAAVAAGGNRRLAAPLLLGTALLVGLVGYETLAITAGFPTWVWLALGGGFLLGAGVVMERRDVGPLETGRRLVDVVTDRYV